MLAKEHVGDLLHFLLDLIKPTHIALHLILTPN
jgi:hypothetical protein